VAFFRAATWLSRSTVSRLGPQQADARCTYGWRSSHRHPRRLQPAPSRACGNGRSLLLTQLVGRPEGNQCDLVELALQLRAESAQGNFLHPVRATARISSSRLIRGEVSAL